ncbi:MAG: hypothetical protein KAW12_05695, partial [Candidatus Aminicenantes bacterium]|nr:hypothetical protein [Candidatus Aminicenantes bacterium]
VSHNDLLLGFDFLKIYFTGRRSFYKGKALIQPKAVTAEQFRPIVTIVGLKWSLIFHIIPNG